MAWWTTTASSTSGSDPKTATPHPSSSSSSTPSTIPSTPPQPQPQPQPQPDQQPPNPYLENNPARTGFDPKTQWWVNYFKILTGQVTNEGIFHYREHRYRANESRDVKRCEEYRDWLFAYSPTVRFLNDKIAELNHGQGMTPANVLCRRCPARLTAGLQVERQSGGFEPAHGILVCANEVRNRGHLEDTLAHEMVHAYDQLRFEVDFRGERDLRQAACTEVGRYLFLSVTYRRRTENLVADIILFFPTDTSIDAERRVQVDTRSPDARELHPHRAVPELRAAAGGAVDDGEAVGQERRAGRQGRQRGLGLVLLRHAAL